MILSKLLFTKLPLVIDIEFKWSRESLSMGEASLSLTARTEKRFGKSFILILDSGYPAGPIIGQPRKDINSKSIVSCSVSRVSGAFRRLVEAGSLNFRIGGKTLLWRPSDNLVAFIAKKPKYTQVLITNACRINDSPVLELPLHPMSFDQASALASSFSVNEMMAHFNWPAPSTNETVPQGIYPLRYVSEITGVDLTAPLDAENFVSEKSLSPLSSSSLKSISDFLGCSKTGMKKGDHIKAILSHHPKAKPSPPPTVANSKKRKADTDEPGEGLSKSLEHDYKTLFDRLMGSEDEPRFAKLYTSNYGLEDRVNAVLYRFFWQYSSVQPESRFTWIFFYICIINSYCLRCERVATKQEKDEKEPDDESLFAELPNFLLSVVQEIARQYVHPSKPYRKYRLREV